MKELCRHFSVLEIAFLREALSPLLLLNVTRRYYRKTILVLRY